MDSKLDEYASMVNILPTTNKQKKKKKPPKARFETKKLDFDRWPKQYLLYHVPVCGGFVAYYLRLFNGHVLWLYNNEKNGKREDMQQWEQSTFTKGKYSN